MPNFERREYNTANNEIDGEYETSNPKNGSTIEDDYLLIELDEPIRLDQSVMSRFLPLQEFGVEEVLMISEERANEIREALQDPSLSPQDLQLLLNEIPFHISEPARLGVTKLTTILHQAGIDAQSRENLQSIAETLHQYGVAVILRDLKHGDEHTDQDGFIAEADVDIVLDIFKNEPEFDTYRQPDCDTSREVSEENEEPNISDEDNPSIEHVLTPGAEPIKIASQNQEGFELLQKFVAEAAAQGVHFSIPLYKRQPNEVWARQWNILGTYLYTHATYSQLGKVYKNISRERVRQIVKESAERLYMYSPQELRDRYPVEQLGLGKPLSDIERIRRSEVQGGRVKEVLELLQQGKSTKEIQEILGLSRSQVQNLRKTVRHHNKTLDYIQQSRNSEIIEHLTNPDASKDSRQQQLDRLSIHALYSKRMKGVVTRLSDLNKQAGLNTGGSHRKKDLVIEAIKTANIPIGVVEKKYKTQLMRYGVVANIDSDAVMEVLMHDPTLEPLRKKKYVVQTIGETQEVPSASQLTKSDKYLSLRKLLGDPVWRLYCTSNLSIEELFGDDLPSPVYLYHNGKYVEESSSDEMRMYILNKLQEHGVLDYSSGSGGKNSSPPES